ncbi:hypothetical protein C8J56DRAFT_916540 [Mycena floridula]|nr:hypothetical protein C8J56DRAFT_916540 [Mycena floridula]
MYAWRSFHMLIHGIKGNRVMIVYPVRAGLLPHTLLSTISFLILDTSDPISRLQTSSTMRLSNLYFTAVSLAAFAASFPVQQRSSTHSDSLVVRSQSLDEPMLAARKESDPGREIGYQCGICNKVFKSSVKCNEHKARHNTRVGDRNHITAVANELLAHVGIGAGAGGTPRPGSPAAGTTARPGSPAAPPPSPT